MDLEDYEFNLICERAEVAYKFKASKGNGTLTVESFRQAYNEYDNARVAGNTSWWKRSKVPVKIIKRVSASMFDGE